MITKEAQLSIACVNGNFLDAEKLILENKNIINRDHLNLSILKGSLDIVKLLLKNGADMTEDSLYYSCVSGVYDIVKFLIDNGADCRKDKGEALDYACNKGFYDIVKLLIENGAIVTHENLCTAAVKNHCKIVKLLLNKGVS